MSRVDVADVLDDVALRLDCIGGTLTADFATTLEQRGACRHQVRALTAVHRAIVRRWRTEQLERLSVWLATVDATIH